MTKCRRCAICFARSPRIVRSAIRWRGTCQRKAISLSSAAVSHGPASTRAVEHDRRKNEASSRLAERWSMPATAVQGDAVTTLPKLSKNIYVIVYVDPPIDFTAYDELLKSIDRRLS